MEKQCLFCNESNKLQVDIINSKQWNGITDIEILSKQTCNIPSFFFSSNFLSDLIGCTENLIKSQ